MTLKFRQVALAAIPLRTLVSHSAVAGLLLLSLVTMMLSATHQTQLEGLRMGAARLTAPLFSLLSHPAHNVGQLQDFWQAHATLQAENTQLKEEANALRDWHATALRLDTENRALRALLNLKQEHELQSVTARVFADSGSSFGNSLLVKTEGDTKLRRGMAAITGDGLAGRLVDVDADGRYGRILLLNDISSHVPVVLENSRVRAVLAGTDNGVLELIHLPGDAQLTVGERIVTSGFDGVLPSGAAGR